MMDLLYRSGTALGNFHVFIYGRVPCVEVTRRATMLEF